MDNALITHIKILLTNKLVIIFIFSFLPSMFIQQSDIFIIQLRNPKSSSNPINNISNISFHTDVFEDLMVKVRDKKDKNISDITDTDSNICVNNMIKNNVIKIENGKYTNMFIIFTAIFLIIFMLIIILLLYIVNKI